MKAHFDELLMVKLEGNQINMMCDANKYFIRHAAYENNCNVLCLVLDKALHGCAQSALLWHKLFSVTLLEMGFTLNTHDLCVDNKVIGSK